MATWASVWIIMNPTASTTVAGDQATGWGRFAMAPIVQSVAVASPLRMLTNPRLHPARCRLFRRVGDPVAHDRVKERIGTSRRIPANYWDSAVVQNNEKRFLFACLFQVLRHGVKVLARRV